MPDPTSGINTIISSSGIAGIDETESAERRAQPAGESFGALFENALQRVNEAERSADDAIARLAAGEDVELHQVMLAVEEADIAVQVMLRVRNKLVEAYQDIIRMQV